MLFGLIAGGIANLIAPNPSHGGFFGSIALGIVGAVVSGYLGQRFLEVGITGFNLISFSVAIIGSIIVLAASRLFILD
jgi:uncharacterized membrane protein YeaQ/YmgE (transglycosylase-associated protein family)